MKILKVELIPTKIPVIRPHRMAIGTTTYQENIVVKVHTNDGLTGLGEVPHMVGISLMGESQATVKTVLQKHIIPKLIGQNPFNIEKIQMDMDNAIPWNPRAKSGINIALLDLIGKALKTPVYNLLGGKIRDAIPLSWSIPITGFDEGVNEALRMVERGWQILKVKVGRADANEDVEMVKRLRDALGSSVRLRADANQAYSPKTAIRVIRKMERYDIEFMEQPVLARDFRWMAEVSKAVNVPIMADESLITPRDAVQLLEQKAAQYFSIYMSKSGGVLVAKKLASIAQAYDAECYIGGALESIIGASAGLHFGASTPNVTLGCELGGQFLLQEDISAKPLEFEGGSLKVPEGPGLGINLDEKKIRKYKVEID